MWTGSTTVLQWLHSVEKQTVFSANRVAEILDLTTVDEWNYVQSCNNPADAGTRGLPASALQYSPWLKGQAFLLNPNFPFQRSNKLQLRLKGNKADAKTSEQVDIETAAMAAVTTTASTFDWHCSRNFCA